MYLYALTLLWGKKYRSYRGSKLGGFWAITPECLGVQRAGFAPLRHGRGACADGEIFMKFRIAATWEEGKVYGFLLGFHMVNFVLSPQAAAKGSENFVLKFGLEIRKGY